MKDNNTGDLPGNELQGFSYIKRDCEHCFCQIEMIGGSFGNYSDKPGIEHEACCMCGTRRVKWRI